MAQMQSDEALIALALQGQQQSYAQLVERYQHYVFTLAVRMVKNREEAAEVAQDSFLRAFRYLSDFRGEAKFSTWLYRIVHSVALNHLRRRRLDVLSIDDTARPVTLPVATQPDASDSMELQERRQAIHLAIQRLPPDDAEVITLFYLYENSLDEICQIMDLTMTNA
ncbi:MAG: RNA polymerase sigma factor, partial [Saprospiraceae bacterium]